MGANAKLRTVASVAARMGSSRLPGKVLADVNGRPALLQLLERLRRAETLDAIVVATTEKPGDDDLVRAVEAGGYPCFRGSEDDVLARIVGAHQMMGTELIVEVTGDCTLVDPDVIDLGVRTFALNDADAVTNVREPQFPQGVDVQVFRYDALAEVEATIDDPAVREHVSLYFYEHPELYRTLHLIAPKPYYSPDQRLQLDYPEDLELIRQISRRLEPIYGTTFGTIEILHLLRSDPALAEINRHCVEKPLR